MADSDTLSRQFDDAAGLYDEVRPHYPEAPMDVLRPSRPAGAGPFALVRRHRPADARMGGEVTRHYESLALLAKKG